MSEERFGSRSFLGKQRGGEEKDRIPPGQYLTNYFPAPSAGPTPHIPFDKRTFTMDGLLKEKILWTGQEFLKLPSRNMSWIFPA